MGGELFLCLDVLVHRDLRGEVQVVSGVRAVCDDVTCPVLHSGVVLKLGRCTPMTKVHTK